MYVPVNGGTSEFNVARKHCPTKLRRLGAKKSWIFKLEYDTKKHLSDVNLQLKYLECVRASPVSG